MHLVLRLFFKGETIKMPFQCLSPIRCYSPAEDTYCFPGIPQPFTSIPFFHSYFSLHLSHSVFLIPLQGTRQPLSTTAPSCRQLHPGWHWEHWDPGSHKCSELPRGVSKWLLFLSRLLALVFLYADLLLILYQLQDTSN